MWQQVGSQWQVDIKQRWTNIVLVENVIYSSNFALQYKKTAISSQIF